MSILALTARATRLVVSCRATTLQPLSVSTRLFRHHTNLLCSRPMARPKRQEDPLLPVPLPRRRPSRANTRNLAASVKPELAAEIKNLAEREQTSVTALVEEATINLLKARGQIGRAHVCTPVTKAHLVCHILHEKQ